MKSQTRVRVDDGDVRAHMSQKKFFLLLKFTMMIGHKLTRRPTQWTLKFTRREHFSIKYHRESDCASRARTMRESMKFRLRNYYAIMTLLWVEIVAIEMKLNLSTARELMS